VVETGFPFGLFRAWTVWRPAARVLAWPQPEHPAPPLPPSAGRTGEERPHRRGAGSELDGVRPWRRGDSMRQVVWKKVARSGELVSRETAGTAARELWLDWADTAGGDAEKRLSRLAAWVLRPTARAWTTGCAAGHRTAAGPGRCPPPAPRWTCWRRPGMHRRHLRERLAHLPRDTRDTLFQLA
jgi:uncharacterized protein (DUF58 family)